MVRVGRPGHGCPGALSVDGKAYTLSVFGGLRCDPGAEAIGPFLDTGIDPAGWDCATVDPRAGHDAACVLEARPSRRVTSRRVTEV